MMWPCPELDEVVHIRTGTINPLKYPEMEFELFSIPGFDIGSPEIKVGSEILSNKNVVKPDDVLFSKLNPRIPRIWIVPKSKHRRQISSTEFWPLVCDQRLLSNHYLRYFLLKLAKEGVFSDSIEAATRSRSRIKPFHLLHQHIPLPPLSEQRRIVEILDQADALRKKRAEADAKAARILPALFYKMFGDPATNKDQTFQSLVDCAEILMGQSPPGETYNREGDGLPFFQGKLEFGSVHPIVRQWCSSPTRIAEPGDVLLCVRAPVGPTNIADTKCAIGRGLAIIRPIPSKSTTEFLFYSMRVIEKDLAKIAQGSTFTAIRRQDVEKIRVPKAGMKEQAAFSAKAKIIQVLIDKGTTSINNIERLFIVLLHRAFTGDLTAKWREAHMKELLQEMEQQAKELEIKEP